MELQQSVLAARNPNTQKNRPHTLFASGPPTASKWANGTMGTAMPPRPFTNGVVPPGQMMPLRPAPPLPQAGPFPPPMRLPPPSFATSKTAATEYFTPTARYDDEATTATCRISCSTNYMASRPSTTSATSWNAHGTNPDVHGTTSATKCPTTTTSCSLEMISSSDRRPTCVVRETATARREG
ncbi:hypothetical protein ACLOJK_002846 [Asimina triloba]